MQIEFGGRLQTLAGQPLRADAQDEHKYAPRHGHPAEQGMQDEDEEEVDGHPRRVKESEDGAAAQKVAQRLHVARAALLPPRALGRGGGQKR